jgi:hypothetical protein
MLKDPMARGLPLSPFLILLFVGGCAKTGVTPKTEPATASAGTCAPATVAGVLADIRRQETAKESLETAAKGSPEKGNFRKLFDAEVAFATAADEKLTLLTNCGAEAGTLSELKNKVAKSRANVTYLSESFPDFK